MSKNSIALGRFRLGVDDHVLLTNDGEIRLSPLASQLLQILAQRPGELVERAELVDQLWRGDWLIGDPALTRVISEIRSITGDDRTKPTLIQTVPRRGYRLIQPANEIALDGGLPVAARTEGSAWRKFILTTVVLTTCLAILGLVATAARYFR